MDAETKIRAENIRIMLTDLSSMVDDTIISEEAR
jgi:hypothetical protein